MNTVTKKSVLYVVILSSLVVVLSAVRDDTVLEKVKDIDTVNKATCVNSLNTIVAAEYQRKMLDQQILLSAADGRGEEAAAIGTQVNELNAYIKVAKELIADPKLDCRKYFTEEDTKVYLTP